MTNNPIQCNTCEHWLVIYPKDRDENATARCGKMSNGLFATQNFTRRDFGCIYHQDFPKLLKND